MALGAPFRGPHFFQYSVFELERVMNVSGKLDDERAGLYITCNNLGERTKLRGRRLSDRQRAQRVNPMDDVNCESGSVRPLDTQAAAIRKFLATWAN